jgi:hypothetical protein
MNENEYIDNVIADALGRRDGRAFFPDEVVREVAKKLHGDALDLPGLIRQKVHGRLKTALRRKDRAGVRLYGCYATGSGFRWQSTRSMTLTTFRTFVLDQEMRAEGFRIANDPLRRLLDEMERTGAQVMGEAYDRVIGEQAA